MQRGKVEFGRSGFAIGRVVRILRAPATDPAAKRPPIIAM